MSDQCDKCGICCNLFLINLNEEEYRSGNYKTLNQDFGYVDDFEDAELCGANILETKEDDSCIYLKGKECSIHNDRPQVCENFFCRSKDPKWKRMIDTINEAKSKY